jgi:hypothetical protein
VGEAETEQELYGRGGEIQKRDPDGGAAGIVTGSKTPLLSSGNTSWYLHSLYRPSDLRNS